MVQVLNVNFEIAVNLPERNAHYTASDISEILQEYINDFQSASFLVISTEIKKAESKIL